MDEYGALYTLYFKKTLTGYYVPRVSLWLHHLRPWEHCDIVYDPTLVGLAGAENVLGIVRENA